MANTGFWRRIFIGIILCIVPSTQSATIYVPGDFGTIQAAIDDPNTMAGDEAVGMDVLYLFNQWLCGM